MTGFYGPPPGMGHGGYQYKKVDPPKNLKDLPRYFDELLGGFFSRLWYIVCLVWKTSPLILCTLLFISVFDGVMGPIGTVISSSLISEMQKVVEERAQTGTVSVASFWGSAILTMLITLFAYRIIKRVVDRISNTIIRAAGEKVVKQVKLEIMNKAKTVDLASFDNPAFYEKLENANREAGNRPVQTMQSLFGILSDVIALVSYIGILATIPNMWWMPVGIVIITIPSAIVNFVYRRKNFQYMRSRSSDRRQMNYYADLLVNKDMVKEIRIFNLSDKFIGRYESVFSRYYAGLRRLIVHESAWMIGIAIVSASVNCFFYGVIAYGVFLGTFDIGQYSKFTNSLTNIATHVTSLINTSASIYEGTLFIDNLLAFMHEKQTIVPSLDTPAGVKLGVPHTIEFDHVSFAYPGKDYCVIKDFSTSFRPGETVVLVGLNGAGKTTLIKLLTRLYDPTEGRILLDGRDLKEYSVEELYGIFGIIFQDFGKYAVSVRENIQFGDIDRPLDDSRIEESAKQANATDYINNLPAGYDTQLMRIFDRDGIELSGGQWQKLGIARAFYRDSDILILDEPTASLDPMAEQEIFNQFDNLRQDKTTIFVSHRLSSAVIATKIIVLKQGQLIEEGTHKELMEAHGEYYNLFATQARRYVEGGKDLIDEDDPDASVSEEGRHHRHGEGRANGEGHGFRPGGHGEGRGFRGGRGEGSEDGRPVPDGERHSQRPEGH